ncbi:MAG: insulinase family protein [Planctomycetes bacterium]|nr:insulinase family protein [Planctomycetota bacterium]
MLKRNSRAILLVLLCACGGERRMTDGTPRGDDGRAGTAPENRVQGGDLLAGLQSRTLKNGMKIVVKEDRALPVVATCLGFRVGSVNETAEMTGLAHYLEHMLFKGTDRYKRGEIDRITFEAGGANNAWTSEDMTVYWFHVAADKLDEFLALEANRMTKCTMDAVEFQNEKKVVLEELNQRLDSPWGPLGEEMEKVVFAQSGYNHPILGLREHLDKMTREQMVNFYRTYYQPNNAILVIVGDVRVEECFAAAAKHFEPLPAAALPPPPKGKEPPQEKERRFTVETEDAADRLLVAFRSDVVGTKTDIVLDVVSTLLSHGKKSRLHLRLVEKEDLVAEGGVETTNNARKHDGVFYVQVELKPGARIEAAEKAVLEELERLRAKPVDTAELQRAKNILRASFAFGKESTIDLAQSIVQFEVLGLPDYLGKYMGRVAAVTPADIQETVRAVFDAKRRTVGTALHKEKKDGKNGRRSGPSPARCARSPFARAQAAPDLGEYWEVRLRNGLTLLAKRKEGVPVVSVQAYVRAGALLEPDDKAGVATLTGEMLDEGIRDEPGRRTLGHEQIAGMIEDVGGALQTGATGVSVKVLSEHRNLAFDLVRDLLLFPSFPNDRFKKLKQDQLAEIQSMDDDPQSVARRLFYETVYPNHPMRRPGIGYANTVEKIARDDVIAHHRRFFRPENAIVAVVGDVNPSEALADLARRFGDWRGGGAWERPEVPGVSRQTEPRERYEFRRKNQVNVYLGHVGIDRLNPDYAALALMEYVLCKGSGFTDRMSMKIRDEMGFAYTVGGGITDGAGEVAGPFVLYIGTKAEQKDDALAAAREELRKFVDEGPTDAEVESAKKFLSRSVVFEWETSGSVAEGLIEMRRFNLSPDHLARFVKTVRGLTREDVKRVAQKYLDAKNLSLVIVGPVDKEGKVIK